MSITVAVARSCRLVLAVVTCSTVLAWPARYVAEFRAEVTTKRRATLVATGPGWVAVTVQPAVAGDRPVGWRAALLTPARRHELAYPRVYSAAGDYHFYVPLWVVGSTAGLVAVAAVATRRLRFQPSGVCRQCGYDLRATPDRCPECGTTVLRS